MVFVRFFGGGGKEQIWGPILPWLGICYREMKSRKGDTWGGDQKTCIEGAETAEQAAGPQTAEGCVIRQVTVKSVGSSGQRGIIRYGN